LPRTKVCSQNDKQSKIIGHDESGNNAINSATQVDLQSRDGIIILETGNYNMPLSIAGEWIFWKARIADYVVMMRNKPYLITLLIIGYFLIFLSWVLIIQKRTALQSQK
jgi:hypothetical protein